MRAKADIVEPGPTDRDFEGAVRLGGSASATRMRPITLTMLHATSLPDGSSARALWVPHNLKPRLRRQFSN
jgi:hypothetical protein